MIQLDVVFAVGKKLVIPLHMVSDIPIQIFYLLSCLTAAYFPLQTYLQQLPLHSRQRTEDRQ